MTLVEKLSNNLKSRTLKAGSVTLEEPITVNLADLEHVRAPRPRITGLRALKDIPVGKNTLMREAFKGIQVRRNGIQATNTHIMAHINTSPPEQAHGKIVVNDKEATFEGPYVKADQVNYEQVRPYVEVDPVIYEQVGPNGAYDATPYTIQVLGLLDEAETLVRFAKPLRNAFPLLQIGGRYFNVALIVRALRPLVAHGADTVTVHVPKPDAKTHYPLEVTSKEGWVLIMPLLLEPGGGLSNTVVGLSSVLPNTPTGE